jgi:hypothetical protein
MVTSRDAAKRYERLSPVVPIFDSGETYAVLQIVPDPATGAGNTSEAYSFDNFLLQSAREESNERLQIFETFKSPIIYFSGSQPVTYSYSGMIPTGLDGDGTVGSDQFMSLYASSLRGTKCAENGTVVSISYDTVLVTGFMIRASMHRVADNPSFAQFDFTLLMTDVRYLSGG